MSDEQKKNAKRGLKILIGASPAVILVVFIVCIVTPIIGLFTGQGTEFSLPEIIGRGTRIGGEFSYSGDDEYEDRVWKWTIKKAREDVSQMQKVKVFKTSLDADADEKDLAWRKKVMATSVIYQQFSEGHYIVNPADLDKTDPNPDNDKPWWAEDNDNYKHYFAEILGKPEYTSEEWTAFAECFTGDDWTSPSYEPESDRTWADLEALLGIEIDDSMVDSIIQCADIMKDVVKMSYVSTNDAYDDTFKILPWSSEECQAMWDMMFDDYDNNSAAISAGMWERYPTDPSDVMTGPQCTDFASWRCWKEYGHGTAGGNGDMVATFLAAKFPNEFALSDTPAACAIGSGRTSSGGIHVFWVEDYDEEKRTLIISEGNYATRNANGILEYHGICLNRMVTLDSLQALYDYSLNFAVPNIEAERPDPGDPANPGANIGSNLQDKY